MSAAPLLSCLGKRVWLGERVAVDGVVSLIFTGWVPQDGVSAGAVTRVGRAFQAPMDLVCGWTHQIRPKTHDLWESNKGG